jgi:hypothetical protein
MQKPMSKVFYLGGYFGGLVVFGIIYVVAFGGMMMAAQRNPNHVPTAGIGLMGLALVPLIFSMVVMAMFLHRMWASIQDGQARMSPGKAVGFMFIPLFNIYWLFQVIYGFAQDYNKYIARRSVSVPRINEQLFLFYPISAVACVVPFVNLLAAPASIVMMVIVVVQTCDAVNALIGASAPGRTMAMSAEK